MISWRKGPKNDDKCSSFVEEEWLAVKEYGNLLSTMSKVTIDQGDLTRNVITSWNEDLLDVDHLTHGDWVVYLKTWSRRSLPYERPQTCRDQSNVWHSQRLVRVTQKFEAKILCSDTFAQVNLRSAAPTLQHLRIGLRKRQSGKSKGREAAWKLAKSVLGLNEQERATFFSPSESKFLPESTLEPEEREFVIDYGASMQMISKKDLNDAEMDTLTKSCSPTIVIVIQWRSADAWRGSGVCQRIGKILDYESPRKHASSIDAWKALRWKRIFLWMVQWSTTSH